MRRGALLLLGGAAALAGCGGNGVAGPSPAPVPRLGAFERLTPLPEPRHYVAAARAGSFVYVVGGATPDANASDTVYMAPMLGDGRLGAWAETSPLQTARRAHGLVVVEGRALLAVGGEDSRDPISTERARIRPDGTLEEWRSDRSLPDVRSFAAVATVGGRLFVIGGSSLAGVTGPVFAADLGADELGPWRALAPLPNPSLGGAAAGLPPDRLFVLNGNTSGNTWSDLTYSTAVAATGEILPWTLGPPVSEARYFTSLVPDGFGGLLAVGGLRISSVSAAIHRTAVDAAGRMTGWSSFASLPTPLFGHAAYQSAGALYLFGGVTAVGAGATTTANAWRAPIGF